MRTLGTVLILALLLGFSFTPGNAVAQQQETAWAGDHEFPGNNWAMYFLKFVRCQPGCANVETYTLWAGQNINVGTVSVINQPAGNDIFIQIETFDGWVMMENHVAYGNDFEDIPQNGGGNPMIGHFQIVEEREQGVTLVTYRIEIPDGWCGFDGYLATHASVQYMGPGAAGHSDSDKMELFTMSESLPMDYSLAEPYPNPFNASATVSVVLPEAAPLTVNVYSVTGQHVGTLASGVYGAGTHKLHFNATDLASGVYFVRASVPGKMNEMKKVMLVR
jgi:Secretion system C-terminal sorting domain